MPVSRIGTISAGVRSMRHRITEPEDQGSDHLPHLLRKSTMTMESTLAVLCMLGPCRPDHTVRPGCSGLPWI